MTATSDRLAAALASTDLGWTEQGTGDVEYVAALGYAGIHVKTASAVYRLVQTLDPSSYHDALRHTRTLVQRLNARLRWGLKGMEFGRLAKEALDYFLCPVCPSCLGRKYKLIPGSDRHLSDKECPACKGTGIRRLRGADKERIREIATALEDGQGRIVGGVRKRLKSETGGS